MSDFRKTLYETRLEIAVWSVLFAIIAIIAALEGKIACTYMASGFWVFLALAYLLGKAQNGN